MDAIETLMQEHRLIENALDSLERWAARADTTADRARLGQYVAFFRELADELHHGKEEDILFEVMQRHGFSREQGPLAVMLHEHDLGRGWVNELGEVAAGQGPLTETETARIRSVSSQLSSMLKSHILKEDRVLYPMARARLPQSAQQEIDARVADFNGQHAERLEVLTRPRVEAEE